MSTALGAPQNGECTSAPLLCLSAKLCSLRSPLLLILVDSSTVLLFSYSTLAYRVQRSGRLVGVLDRGAGRYTGL